MIPFGQDDSFPESVFSALKVAAALQRGGGVASLPSERLEVIRRGVTRCQVT